MLLPFNVLKSIVTLLGWAMPLNYYHFTYTKRRTNLFIPISFSADKFPEILSVKYFSNTIVFFTINPDICTLFKKGAKKLFIMSRICDLTGKGSLVGNNVSNSNVKTKRRFHPNLKLKKFYVPEEDKWITLKVSTSAIKTISKNGITACINKFVKKGYI